MPTVEEQLQKKKPFKKKTYRSYLSLDETLDDVDLKDGLEKSQQDINANVMIEPDVSKNVKVVDEHDSTSKTVPDKINIPNTESVTPQPEIILTCDSHDIITSNILITSNQNVTSNYEITSTHIDTSNSLVTLTENRSNDTNLSSSQDITSNPLATSNSELTTYIGDISNSKPILSKKQPDKIDLVAQTDITSNNTITSTPEITGNCKGTSKNLITSKSAVTEIKSSNPNLVDSIAFTSNPDITGTSSITSNFPTTGNSKITEYQIQITKTNLANPSVITSNLPTTSNEINTSNLNSNSNDLVTSNANGTSAQTSNHTSNQQVTTNGPTEHVFSLSGLQLQIVKTIFNLAKDRPDLTTPNISIEHLSNLLGRNKNHSEIEVLKKTIIKLQHKGFLKKNSFSVGRGGSTSYTLHSKTFLQFVQNLDLETSNQLVTKPVTKPVINPSSMYVGNKNTIHTYKEQTVNDSTSEFDHWIELRNVDFSSTEQFGIKSNVIDTFKKNKWVITRDQLEEHLERFVRYFTEKEFEKRREPIKSPYSFFLSSIKAISKGEPDPICDIKIQFEIAQQIALHNKLKEMEVRRREVEAIEKQMDQYRDSEFEHWVGRLGENEKVQFVPPNKIAELGSVRYQLLLKDYYTQNIWPEIKQDILKKPRIQN